MDYESMSDFEINKRVAESLGMNAREKSSCVNHGEGESAVSVGFGGCMRAFAPCNNPSDAWPIITENRIGGHWGKAAPGAYFAVSRLEEFVVMGKNPLRAACIVYLMMREAK